MKSETGRLESRTVDGEAGCQWRNQVRMRVLVPLLGGMVFLLLLFAFIFKAYLDDHHKRALDLEAEELERAYTEEIHDLDESLRALMVAVQANAELEQAFRDRDMKTLLAKSRPLFEALKNDMDVTHFYYHNPDLTNFLRVHAPEHSGGALNRYTAEGARRTNKFFSGAERGPLGAFVHRGVQPWIKDGEVLGYIELGKEFQNIVEDLNETLRTELFVVVDKQKLNRKVWEKELADHHRAGDWDEFPSVVVMDRTTNETPEVVKDILGSPAGELTRMRRLELSKESLHLFSFPLFDQDGREIADVVGWKDVTAGVANARRSMLLTVGGVVGLALLLCAVLFVYLGRLERTLEARDRESREVNASLRQEIGAREQVERELRLARDGLESRVEERTVELRRSNELLEQEVRERKRAAEELARVQKEMMEASRRAGMAEVATGVLHNVGNVLTSVNVSANLMTDMLHRSKASGVGKTAALLREHQDDLPGFFSEAKRRQQLTAYLEGLDRALVTERKEIQGELDTLTKNIEHIKDIVSMQQSYAQVCGVVEKVPLTELVEDALRLNAAAMARHDVQVIREFNAHPDVEVDRHKVIQVLVNLIRNAKYALDDGGRLEKHMTLRVGMDEEGLAFVEVEDDGVGISEEHLARIFTYGFSTRQGGHGFGLHSSALVVKEMGGRLQVHSDGVGRGARFRLGIPLHGSNKENVSCPTMPIHAS